MEKCSLTFLLLLTGHSICSGVFVRGPQKHFASLTTDLTVHLLQSLFNYKMAGRAHKALTWGLRITVLQPNLINHER